ncbi:hypothetical protein VE02_09604 [Pseudogymnoascus sp. 03VT05]|nr:hypothetical protein VE02_09604 [Pseudogymnoascus sp. 03VT05]
MDGKTGAEVRWDESPSEQGRVLQSQLARRQIQMHFIASWAAGVAYDRLRSLVDASAMAMAVVRGGRERDSRLAHSRFQLHIIAAGAAVVVAAKGARSELHQRDALLAESQMELQRREEKLASDTNKLNAKSRKLREDRQVVEAGREDLATDVARINNEVLETNSMFQERVEEFERNEASAREEVGVMYDKVRADEKALEQAKLELERRGVELESGEERLLQAEAKARDAIIRLTDAETKAHDASAFLRDRDVAIAGLTETNTKLTVVVASLSREKDSRDATPSSINPAAPSKPPSPIPPVYSLRVFCR